jgi:hypothetical protein
MAEAATRDDVILGAVRCAGIKDNRLWLDCYYGAAQPMRAELGLQPAPATQQELVPPAIAGAPATITMPAQAVNAPPRQQPQQQQRQGFWSRLVSQKDPDPPEQPTKLASYKFNAAGLFTVTLANGETWEQDPGDGARARWNRPPQAYTVQVTSGESSTHRLKVANESYQIIRD